MSLRHNILSGLIGQGAVMFLSLISTRLVFRELGADVLGIISFAVALTFFFICLADMGMSILVAREVAVHRKEDIDYARNLIGSMSMLAWAAFFLSCIIVVILSPLLVDKWLHVKTMSCGSAVLAIQIISVALLLAIPRAVYGAVVSGYERIDLWNIANILTVGIQQMGMIGVVALGGGVFQVAIWYIVSAIIGLIPFVLLVARLAGAKSLQFLWRPDIVWKNLHFGSRLFANSMVSYLVTQADRWSISKFLPLSALGYYGFAQGLVSKGAIVPGAIANVAFPALSSSVSTCKKSVLMSQYEKLQDLCCYLYIPVSAAVAMLGTGITYFVFNSEIVGIIWLPLVFLAIGQFLLGALYVPYWLAIAMKNPGIALRANLWALVIVLPFTVLLTFRFGLSGAAFSAILYSVWQLIYFVPRFCSICLERSAKVWFIRLGTFSGIGTIAYGTAWGSAWLIGESLSIPGLVTSYIIGTIVFIIAGWFVIGKELKDEFRKIFEKITMGFMRKETCQRQTSDR